MHRPLRLPPPCPPPPRSATATDRLPTHTPAAALERAPVPAGGYTSRSRSNLADVVVAGIASALLSPPTQTLRTSHCALYACPHPSTLILPFILLIAIGATLAIREEVPSGPYGIDAWHASPLIY
eukprot:scaffold21940_cov122-Isochrysis_galbana.AAC.1